VSFSGGKDSTVLLHLVRKLYPNVPAVFCDTGLEYPEIRNFVKTIDNVTWIKPKMNFKEVIEKYGFPVIGKATSQKIYEIRNTNSEKLKNIRMFGDYRGEREMLPKKWRFLISAPFLISSLCCDKLKKIPFNNYEKNTKRKPIIGTLAVDSQLRAKSYLKYGCNSFEEKYPKSQPLSFWIDMDIWTYLKLYKIPYSKIYDMGEKRTGCMFCMFGVHLEKGRNRFQRMKITHPKQYDYCINKLGCGKVLDFINVPY
jgi:3'-phosphoadenosine 5'-phosphosulfate sulfotransferase (PAPS reductase)/FAD synthetase